MPHPTPYPVADAVGLNPPVARPDAVQSPGTPSEWLIRVVLADDHALMLRSLRLLLDGEEDVDVVAEARDLPAVTRHVHSHVPNVLVLDLGMLNGSSVDVIRRLREQIPGTQIVVVTMEDAPGFAHQALDAGAIAFVLKDYADTELAEAVRSAAYGERYLSPRVRSRSGRGLPATRAISPLRNSLSRQVSPQDGAARS